MSENKAYIVNVRVTPEMRMRLDEIAESTGVSIGGFVRTCVDRVISMMYDSDGYLMDVSKMEERGKINHLDGFYPISDISSVYGIPYGSIYALIRSGKARTIKHERSVYVRLSDVLRKRN